MGNYYTKLSQEIMSYLLCPGKCGNYRDTGVSKNILFYFYHNNLGVSIERKYATGDYEFLNLIIIV